MMLGTPITFFIQIFVLFFKIYYFKEIVQIFKLKKVKSATNDHRLHLYVRLATFCSCVPRRGVREDPSRTQTPDTGQARTVPPPPLAVTNQAVTTAVAGKR